MKIHSFNSSWMIRHL